MASCGLEGVKNQSQNRGCLSLTVLALLTSCQAVRSDPPAAASPVFEGGLPTGWQYTFGVGEALDTLTTRVCFEGALPARLKPQTGGVQRALGGVWRVRGEEEVEIEGADEDIPLGSLREGDCLRFEQDLVLLAGMAGGRPETFSGRGVLALSPDYWLWAPDPRPEEAQVSATFDLPSGFEVAVPWPEVPAQEGVYSLPGHLFEWRAHAVLGRFDSEVVEVGGSHLRLVFLREGAWSIGRARLRAWAVEAAEATSLLYGRFPVDRAQLLIVQVRGGDVGFGTVARGGGPSVLVEVGVDIGERELEDDWVATHELTHLGLPKIKNTHAWLYEGFATYYEPILRARLGDVTTRRSWERLHDGFLRGAGSGSGRALQAESAEMFRTYAFWRVYWGGAAVMLLADLAMRQSGGASLEDHLASVLTCCLGRGVNWEAEALLTRLAMKEGPSLWSVARPHLESSDFPDLTGAYEALGLRFDPQGRLLTQPGDPGAALRRAIMGRDVE